MKLAIDFDNLSFDGDEPSHDWQVIHRFVGDFVISVNGSMLYSEAEFCLVEFATQTLQWLQRAKETEQDFLYSSVEFEHPGLVWIVKQGNRWKIGSIHQKYEEERLFDLDEISVAIRTYVDKLNGDLLRKFGIEGDKLISDYSDRLIL